MSNSVATKLVSSTNHKNVEPFKMPEGVPENAKPFFWDKNKTILLGFTWIIENVEYEDEDGNDLLVDEMWSYRYINGKITNHVDDHFIAYAQLGLDALRWVKGK